RPASAIQMSPFLATSMPRGLSSPLATTFQPLPPLFAWALGTATSTAITASATRFLTCMRPPPSGFWRRFPFSGVVARTCSREPRTPRRHPSDTPRVERRLLAAVEQGPRSRDDGVRGDAELARDRARGRGGAVAVEAQRRAALA